MRVIQATAYIIKPDGNPLTKEDAILDMKFLERIGRLCYKSEGSITEDSYDKFLRDKVKSGHHSILEHVSRTVLLVCDRGVSHEAVRHRLTSPTQESTRYCNYSKDKFGNNVTYIDIREGIKRDPVCRKLSSGAISKIIQEWSDACLDAEMHYLKMLDYGASPQIARSVLNNSTKTELVLTANLREWMHIDELRYDSHAHPQMVEVIEPIHNIFLEYYNPLFADLHK